MRFVLALRCFFGVLFGGRLPEAARALLPVAEPRAPALPAGPAAAVQPAPAPTALRDPRLLGEGAVQLLGMLQREGRLVDFLKEDIDGYSDAQIGAAVRDIHRGCNKVLAEYFAIEPVLGGTEDSVVRVDPGFDPARIKLVGNVSGEPPFTGRLKHGGWRATRVALPERSGTIEPTVVAPAEVEL